MNGEPRNERREIVLTDAQFERLAKRAAELAAPISAELVREQFKAQVGGWFIRTMLREVGKYAVLIGVWEYGKTVMDKIK